MRVVADPTMNDFERTLMAALLAGALDRLSTLRAQFEIARPVSRELSGAGFFLKFELPPDVPRVEPRNFELSDVYFDLEGTECGGGAIIFIRDGVISMLEGYSHGAGWPDEPRVFAVRYFDGDQRDLARLAGEIASRQLLTRS